MKITYIKDNFLQKITENNRKIRKITEKRTKSSENHQKSRENHQKSRENHQKIIKNHEKLREIKDSKSRENQGNPRKSKEIKRNQGILRHLRRLENQGKP